jgi:alkylation response protein AidB-like acyl-CoA dehydrogenase
MPTYAAPRAEFRFLLGEVFDYPARIAALPGCGDADLGTVLAILDSGGVFSREVLLPINLPGDTQGCRREGDVVRTPAGYREAYAAFCRDGWPSLAGDPAFGGQGLPASVALFVRELVASGSMAFGMYGGLSQGAYRAIAAHGSDALKREYLPRLVDGSWTGTMCLTEPQAGSDLSRLTTRAVPDGAVAYRVTGNKIFISGGDHDLAQNIVHLVLARLPDAPAGTRGVSLFVVPKRLPDGSANAVACTAIEHKMGIKGSTTAALAFEGSRGWLVGEPNGGLKAMFTMMNSSRIGVAVQSIGVAELALQNARAYALERRQGRAPGSTAPKGEQDPIVAHPDVRRQLLAMKALVEGCRALYVDLAMALDERVRHPDPQARARAESRLALMTPVLKAFASDCAVRVTQLGMSVFGGHGYVHDNGMEQLVRDASIVPLYEGTNGIQALDLLHRKLAADEGRAAAAFAERVAATIVEAGEDAQLRPLAVRLQEALAQLQASTRLQLERVASEPSAAAAGASDYLRLMGLVACGETWLRMAQAARRATGAEAASFYAGKRKAAAFFVAHVLPETAQLARAIEQGAAAIVDVTADEI